MIAVVEVQHAEDLMAGHKHGLFRNRQAEEHGHEQDVSAGEVQPCKAVTGQRRQDQRSECQSARDYDAVEHPDEYRRGADGVDVVLERIRRLKHRIRICHQLGIFFERQADDPQNWCDHDDGKQDDQSQQHAVTKRASVDGNGWSLHGRSALLRVTRYWAMAAIRMRMNRISDAAAPMPRSQRRNAVS